MRTASLLMLSIAVTGCSPTPDAAQVAQEEKYGSETEAKATATQFVRRYVKFPDEAQFGFEQKAQLASEVGGQRNWVVTGSVREKTPSGSKVTNPYQVTMNYEGPDDWKPLVVTVAGEVLFNARDDDRQVARASVSQATPAPGPPAETADTQPAMPLQPTAPADPADQAGFEQNDDASRMAEPAEESPLPSEPPRAMAESPPEPEPQPVTELPPAEPVKPVSELRTWTSIAGTTIDAEFAGYNAGSVTLRKADGTEIIVPFDKLSADDQRFIRRRR